MFPILRHMLVGARRSHSFGVPVHILTGVAMLAGGLAPLACHPPAERTTAVATSAPAQSIDPKRAYLRLAEVPPAPVVPKAESPEPAEPAEAAMRYLREARDRFDEQRWSDAVAAAEKALSIEPRSADARLLIARSAIQQGSISRAEEALREAARSRPDDVAIHQLLGEIAWRENRAEDAIRELRVALACTNATEERPETALARLSLAMALRREGYLTAAIEALEAYQRSVAAPSEAMAGHVDLKQTIALYRGRAPALIGEIHTQLGQRAAAVDAYRRAVAERPEDFSIASQYAMSLAAAGRADEAIQAVHETAARTQSKDDCLKLLDDVCKAAGQGDRYETELARLARDAGNAPLALRAAETLSERGRHDEAIRIFETVAENDPADAEVRYRLAGLHLRREQPRLCVESLVAALAARPDSWPRVEAFLADIPAAHWTNKLVSAAVAVAAEKPGDVDARYVCARFLTRAGREDEALKLLREDPESLKAFAPLQLALAEALAARKEWPAAAEAIQAAIDAGLHDARAYELQGRIAEAQDDGKTAESAYQAAVKRDRKSIESWRALARLAERAGEARRCEQYYRTILEDVDPRDTASREALIRLYINTDRLSQAAELFEETTKLGLTGPAVERCRAIIKLAGGQGGPREGQERLKSYREELRAVIQSYPDDNGARIDLAMTHLAVGEFEEALRLADEALGHAPEDERALELKAGLLKRLLNYEEAEGVTLRLMRNHPRSVPLAEQLVELSLNQANFDGAAIRLRELLQREDLKERRPQYALQLIDVLTLAEKHDAAVEEARRFLDEDPKDALRRDRYLRALSKAGRGQEAIQLATSWLNDGDPTNDRLRRQLISRLQAAKEHGRAQRHVLEWLADAPDDLELNGMLIVLLWGSKNWDEAETLCRVGLESRGDARAYQGWLAQTFVLSQRWDAAIEVYREMVKMPTTDEELSRYIDATMELIRALIAAERYDDGERAINKLMLQITPRRGSPGVAEARIAISLRRLLASVYQLTDRLPAAIEELEQIYRVTPNDRAINNDLGYVLTDHGLQLERAEKMIRLAVGQEPRNSAYLDSLGWARYKRGDFPDAAKWLERAIRLDERRDPVMFDHFGDALYRLDRKIEARGAWEKAQSAIDEERADASLDVERRRLETVVRRKLEQVAEGKPVETAEVAGEPAATQAAAGGGD